MFTVDDTLKFTVFNAIFVGLIVLHYMFARGLAMHDPQSQWTAVLLAALYTISVNTPVGHLTLVVTNFLAFDLFWSSAWTPRSPS